MAAEIGPSGDGWWLGRTRSRLAALAINVFCGLVVETGVVASAGSIARSIVVKGHYQGGGGAADKSLDEQPADAETSTAGVAHVRIRLRRIRVHARTFVWRAQIHHVQGSGDCHRCIRIRAWGAGKTSQVLQADLLSLAWPAPAPWGACVVDHAYPTPSDVRAIISHALESGWQPELAGGTFVLSEREHGAGLSLPAFVLTDRLCTPESADPTHVVIRAYEARQRQSETDDE